jgi:hypothetical protein
VNLADELSAAQIELLHSMRSTTNAIHSQSDRTEEATATGAMPKLVSAGRTTTLSTNQV